MGETMKTTADEVQAWRDIGNSLKQGDIIRVRHNEYTVYSVMGYGLIVEVEEDSIIRVHPSRITAVNGVSVEQS